MGTPMGADRVPGGPTAQTIDLWFVAWRALQRQDKELWTGPWQAMCLALES